MKTKIEVTCPAPTFEDVVLVYDLMASEVDVQAYRRAPGKETASKIIAEVRGWNREDEPFADTNPMAFLLWSAYEGWQSAVEAFVLSPNSLTGSTPSTPPTRAAAS